MLFFPKECGAKPLDSDAVVDGIFAGELSQWTTARDPSGREGMLPRMLDKSHFRRISRRALAEILATYRPYERAGLGLSRLEQRIVELVSWPLADLRLLQRLTCLSGWLAELLGNEQEALRRYTDFLDLRPRRGALVLLARHNCAVLRFRHGDLRGLRDVAFAAIVHEVPAACFNLLNLANIARSQDWFDELQPAVTKWLERLDVDAQKRWIGPGRQALPESFNYFIDHLLGLSKAIKPAQDIARELQIWGRPIELIIKGKTPGGGVPLSACAEAFTLLYPRDLPDDLSARLVRPDPHELWAAKKLAHARKMFEESRDFQTARVEVDEAQKRLGNIIKPGKKTGRLLRACQRLGKQISKEQDRLALAEFQRLHESLSAQVDEVCHLQDISQVEGEQAGLTPLVRQVQELEERCWPTQPGNSCDAQQQKLRRHLEHLEGRRLKVLLQGPYERLLAIWPSDPEMPAAPETLELLKECESIDPLGKVQRWNELRAKLNDHDARFYFEKAFMLACDCARDHASEIKHLLSLALTLQPVLMPHVAPLVTLLHLPDALGKERSFDEIRAALIAQAGLFVRGQHYAQDQLVPPELRKDLLAEALKRMQPALGILGTSALDTHAIQEITQSLWDAFKPVLRQGSPTDIIVVSGILNEWKTACRNAADPRHPIRGALADAEISRRLAEAEIELARQDIEKSRLLVVQAIEFELIDREQAQRTAWLFALTRPLKGSRDQQGRTLERLEAWMKDYPEKEINKLRVQDFDGQLSTIENTTESLT